MESDAAEKEPDVPAGHSVPGLFPIQVICDEPGAKVDDREAVSFIAFVSTMPRIGEKVILEDGVSCVVKDVIYKVMTHAPTKMTRLFPNVYAVRIVKK